jgi:predicted nucleic acid-binding protein
MIRIYFDTNQMYYIRRIAEEAEESDYGNYDWAYHAFPNDPDLVQDIRALCYIVALQYEWDLDFFPSDASFAELSLRNDEKARATQEAWRLFAEGLKDSHVLHEDASFASLRKCPISGRLSLDFIDDPDDRVIVREFAREGADVLLTSDNDILEHKEQLAELGVHVMRPSEWLTAFLDIVRHDEDAVDFLERILFGIGP